MKQTSENVNKNVVAYFRYTEIQSNYFFAVIIIPRGNTLYIKEQHLLHQIFKCYSSTLWKREFFYNLLIPYCSHLNPTIPTSQPTNLHVSRNLSEEFCFLQSKRIPPFLAICCNDSVAESVPHLMPSFPFQCKPSGMQWVPWLKATF